MIYYVTFGQAHPLRHGWVEIEAEDYETAMAQARYTFGNMFSNIYKDNKMSEYFPAGKFGETLYADNHVPKAEPKEQEDYSGATPGDR